MLQEPYRSARRVFWITDNGSSHAGQTSVRRLGAWYPNAIQVQLPVHASWLNQIEIYFSIVSRKVLQPDDFADVGTVAQKLLAFQGYYQQLATPFEWTFTRQDMDRLIARLEPYYPSAKVKAAEWNTSPNFRAGLLVLQASGATGATWERATKGPG